MRIWDIPPSKLCRKHLLGEHRELHALWSVISQNKRGYSHHPETKRWAGKLSALYTRHDALVAEMERRNYIHRSPLDKNKATGSSKQTMLINSIEEQKQLLKEKGCDCLKN